MLFHISCSENLEKDDLVIKEILRELNVSIEGKSKVAILALPVYGCQTCLESSCYFVDNNYNNEQLICLVGGLSKKDVQLKFKKANIENSNIIMELKGLLYSNNIKKVTVFYFKNNKLVSKTKINSENKQPFFTELSAFIQ